MRRKIGSLDTPFWLPARASVCERAARGERMWGAAAPSLWEGMRARVRHRAGGWGEGACSSIVRRICSSWPGVGSGHWSGMLVLSVQQPWLNWPNSARIAAGSGEWKSWRESGARVTICSPSGRMSAAMMPLSSDDLPLDCVPTTTNRGTSGGLRAPAEVAKMPLSVFATRRISSLPRGRRAGSAPSLGLAKSVMEPAT